jgi:hypothetical protein
MGFRRLDAGPKFYDGRKSRTGGDENVAGRAYRFLGGLATEFRGSSPLLGAFERAFTNSADALILISDGLPNPAFNGGLSPSRLVRSITLANTRSREIHTVTVGDYFKYSGTVEFMEALARVIQVNSRFGG